MFQAVIHNHGNRTLANSTIETPHMVAVYLQARHQMTSPQNGEMCYVPRYKIIDQFIGKFDITAGKELYISHNLILIKNVHSCILRLCCGNIYRYNFVYCQTFIEKCNWLPCKTKHTKNRCHIIIMSNSVSQQSERERPLILCLISMVTISRTHLSSAVRNTWSVRKL